MNAAWRPTPAFVLRTPLLPVDEWLAFAADLEAPTATDVDLPRALAADRERGRARLRALVARPDVREALFVASPSLDEALEIWLRAPDSDRGLKAERTLVRYFARMCGRATPFGLFAGCALGRIDDGGTRLELAARDRHRRHTRLDMDYLFALAETLARDPELHARLRYRPNSSLYRATGRIRYVEARLDGKARSYHLVAVSPGAPLDAVLASAQAGSTRAELERLVAETADVDEDEARHFIDELVAAQVIVSDLDPPVTGPEPIHALLRRIEGHAAAAPLAEARAALAAIDAEPLGVAPGRYRAVADRLRALPVPIELSRMFQVDLFTRAEELRIGSDVALELTRAVETLARLARPGDPLLAFREAFVARYEAAEVPLAEVLDEECGIGFRRSHAPAADASPLLAGLAFPPGDGGAEVGWGEREQLLLAKLTGALARGEREIALSDEDLTRLASRVPPALPDSFAVLATIAAESAAAIDEGRYRLRVIAASGPSSANLLGRFCHGDAAIDALVRDELAAEERQRPDAIFAEIVHLPEGRAGNVLLRPALRRWELPFLGSASVAGEQQIAVDDLTVTVVGDRVIMRSRRLGREVIPRLTTAHNYSHPRSLGLYRFLCTMQQQGPSGGLGWSWGPLQSAPFLPRVVRGRVILHEARWRLERRQLTALGAADAAGRWRAAQSLRRELGLPRFVALEDRDNRLPIDLDHVLSVDTFAQLVKQRDGVVLVEMVPGFDEVAVRGAEGRFVHELVVPFRRAAPDRAPDTVATAAPVAISRAADQPTVARRLPPGSDWLYVKLYAGAAAADELLCDVIAPLVDAARSRGHLREWFFVRYADPDTHLRVRFHGDAQRLHEELLPALLAATSARLAEGKLWRTQLDTYHRELERYGGPVGLPLCEQLFTADSDATLSLLQLLDGGDAGADARWRLTLRGVDALLADLGFDLDGKLALAQQMRDDFAREFAVDTRFAKQLGDRFRKERVALERLLDGADASLAPAAPVFAERSARQSPIGNELRAAAAAGRLTVSLGSLARSLVHMHCNRMLRSSARASELVLYDLLSRLYDGRRARIRRS